MGDRKIIEKATKTLGTRIAWLAFGLVLLIVSAAPSAMAQDLQEDGEGRVRIQGRDIEKDEEEQDIDSGPLIEFSEEMRTFIERITRFSRDYRPTFGVIVEDALSLLIKTNPADETLVLPARAYTRSIDGIMPTGLFYGKPIYAQPNDDPDVVATRLSLLARAQEAGLPVFILDKTDNAQQIDDGFSKASSHGYLHGSMTHSEFEVTALPNYPARPYTENPNSILSLHSVRNFVVVGNSTIYGREDEFSLHMNQNNYDLIVVDVFHGRQPLSKRAVETLKFKRNGARRLVYARVNIGTATRYLYYWQENWREGSPPWLGRPLPDDPDSHYVEYWRPEWQRIISGDTASYIYGVVDQGYDGVVLADVDIFQSFDGSTEE